MKIDKIDTFVKNFNITRHLCRNEPDILKLFAFQVFITPTATIENSKNVTKMMGKKLLRYTVREILLHEFFIPKKYLQNHSSKSYSYDSYFRGSHNVCNTAYGNGFTKISTGTKNAQN